MEDAMANATHYDVLGIRPGASQREIRSAYLALAHESHPDKHPGDLYAERRFQEVTDAYDVLSDTARRRAYDLKLKPPKTVAELLLQHTDGRRALEHLFETAPAAPHPGNDEGMIVLVSADLLKKGGGLEITVTDENGERRTLNIQIPPNAYKTPWCRVQSIGRRGENGGNSGDLYLFFQP